MHTALACVREIQSSCRVLCSKQSVRQDINSGSVWFAKDVQCIVCSSCNYVTCGFCLPQKDTFVVSDLHTAFEEDALASSHPLSAPQEDIQTTYDIINMFDAITYSKVESQYTSYLMTTVRVQHTIQSHGINIKEFRFYFRYLFFSVVLSISM